MRKNIKILESRVSRAVKRLRQLSIERDQLVEEVESLREKLESLEQAASAEPPGALEVLATTQAWQVERADTITSVREALNELRSD